MAVFTTFDRDQLEQYLCLFELGDLVSFTPIETGIENSNYFVTLEGDREYVLTILEYLSFNDVPFFNTLMTHLAGRGLPVPAPEKTLDGMTSTIFRGKPALLFPRLPGEHPGQVDAHRCYQVGKALAALHKASASIGLAPGKIRANPYDLDWTRSALEQVGGRLADADRALLSDYLARYEAIEHRDLPRGIIHGDLFRDNTLFVDDELTGIIDFYHACDDILIQDLAIALNDWCSRPDGAIDPDLAARMIEGYESERALTDNERANLPEFQKTAAMRFVLTRLLSGEEDSHLKDPEEFLRIARQLAAG